MVPGIELTCSSQSTEPSPVLENQCGEEADPDAAMSVTSALQLKGRT